MIRNNTQRAACASDTAQAAYFFTEQPAAGNRQYLSIQSFIPDTSDTLDRIILLQKKISPKNLYENNILGDKSRKKCWTRVRCVQCVRRCLLSLIHGSSEELCCLLTRAIINCPPRQAYNSSAIPLSAFSPDTRMYPPLRIMYSNNKCWRVHWMYNTKHNTILNCYKTYAYYTVKIAFSL